LAWERPQWFRREGHRNSARIERRLDVVKSLYGFGFEIVYLVNENHSLATAVIYHTEPHYPALYQRPILYKRPGSQADRTDTDAGKKYPA
jgi:hypothetical protein